MRITDGNIRNSHISVAGLRDFFPPGCVGGSRRSAGVGKAIRIQLEGLNQTIETGIARDAKTGKPRRQFRDRRWVRAFFQHNRVQAGDVLAASFPCTDLCFAGANVRPS